MGSLWPGGPIELPARFRLDGEVYTIGPVSTMDLLYWLAADAWETLAPWSLDEESQERMLRRMGTWDDPFSYAHRWVIASKLFGRLAGTASAEHGDGYFPAHRIASTLLASWLVFEGWCVAHRFRPEQEPLHRVISAGYAVLLESCKDENETTLTKARIWAPAPRQIAQASTSDRARREATLAAAVLAEMGEDDEY